MCRSSDGAAPPVVVIAIWVIAIWVIGPWPWSIGVAAGAGAAGHCTGLMCGDYYLVPPLLDRRRLSAWPTPVPDRETRL